MFLQRRIITQVLQLPFTHLIYVEFGIDLLARFPVILNRSVTFVGAHPCVRLKNVSAITGRTCRCAPTAVTDSLFIFYKHLLRVMEAASHDVAPAKKVRLRRSALCCLLFRIPNPEFRIESELCEILNCSYHLAGVRVLVVVPGNYLNLIEVVGNLGNHGLGSVKE